MQASGNIRWYHRPWVVIMMLFFVLGPLGLPLLYASPRFNKFWKVVLTVLVTIYTVYVVYACVMVVKQTVNALSGFGIGWS